MSSSAWNKIRIENLTSSFKSGESITSKKIFSVGRFPVFGGNGLRGYTDKFTHEGEFVLIGRQGALCGNVTLVSGRIFASEHAIVAATNKDNNIKWLYYALDYLKLNRLSESSAQPGLAVNKLLKLELITPPLKEQTKIAQILNTWDAAIETLEQLIAKKERAKKALMQQLLTGKKRYKEFRVKWEMKSLKEVCIKIQDGNYGAEYPTSKEFFKEGIPFLTSKAIGGNGTLDINKVDFISVEKHSTLKKAQLKMNDVLFTNRGANVGAISIVDKRIAHGNIGPQLTLLRVNETIIDPFFLKEMMTSEFVQKQIRTNDSGSAMNFFGIGETSKFKIFVPPINEQMKISNVLQTSNNELTFLKTQLGHFIQQKKGLMQQLLTGKIRVKK